jgi:phage terminase large subunit-like protein
MSAAGSAGRAMNKSRRRVIGGCGCTSPGAARGRPAAARNGSRCRFGAGRMRIALVAPTAADARDVMVEGESGILGVSPDEEP